LIISYRGRRLKIGSPAEEALSGQRVERWPATTVGRQYRGYSHLMGPNEAGTLALFGTSCRKLIDPEIAEHKGRIIKTTGDGS
jgi:adenylate cyclase